MSAGDLFSFVSIISQTGFAYAAWRLAVKLNKRQDTHEADDLTFQRQVRFRLGITEASD